LRHRLKERKKERKLRTDGATEGNETEAGKSVPDSEWGGGTLKGGRALEALLVV